VRSTNGPKTRRSRYTWAKNTTATSSAAPSWIALRGRRATLAAPACRSPPIQCQGMSMVRTTLLLAVVDGLSVEAVVAIVSSSSHTNCASTAFVPSADGTPVDGPADCAVTPRVLATSSPELQE
jgi:hypothetical protein